MGRLPRYVMNSRKGFGLVERGLYKTLVLLLNNTCTARVLVAGMWQTVVSPTT